MEIVLTGRNFSAEEANQWGLVSKVTTPENLLPEVMEVAKQIASMSQPIANMAKECVNMSYNLSLRDGI